MRGNAGSKPVSANAKHPKRGPSLGRPIAATPYPPERLLAKDRLVAATGGRVEVCLLAPPIGGRAAICWVLCEDDYACHSSWREVIEPTFIHGVLRLRPQEKSMTNQKTGYPHKSAADHRRDKADTTVDRLKDAGERAQEMAVDAAAQAREYGEKAQHAARQFKPFVEKSLKEQPMTTLAGAAVIGFLLGALWKK